MRLTLLIIAISFPLLAFCQPKSLAALKIQNSISIDGKMNEPEWLSASTADGFIENSPNPGIACAQKSEVRILYDNQSMYVFAKMDDAAPDSIMRQFTERDEIGIVDWFGIIIDAYQDGTNAVGFFTTAAGVQYDIKYSAAAGEGNFDNVFGGDSNWDAVWNSAIEFTDDGWQVEMEIPYSALRFPDAEEQKWSVNFARMVRRFRQTSFWNEVDPANSKLLFQSGVLNGIKDIKPPFRLSFTPFVVTYLEDYYDRAGDPAHLWGRSIGGGMDLKYGINDAFTLDMALIPDFGEAQSDNQVLNLSPFEIQFNENRQFFTEGVELFNKGNFFYSRRVGGRPVNYFNVETTSDEEIIQNPLESQLYNATKISGRNSNGLGIGFFNAVSAKTEATIENSEGDQRKVVTAPLTNYNVVSLDQNLVNNSYISLINTNVMRAGSTYDANVTGTVFDFFNKKQTYSLSGKYGLSQQYYTDSISLGNTANLQIQKVTGSYRWEAGYNQESVNYDINDLGLLFAPNERLYYAGASFDDYQPKGKFNRRWLRGSGSYRTLYAPNTFNELGFNIETGAVTKGFLGIGTWLYFEPVRGRDFFGPRAFNWTTYYEQPRFFFWGGFLSSDYRKKLAYDFRWRVGRFNDYNQGEGRYGYDLRFLPRVRVNDKLSFIFGIETENEIKELGWTETLDDGTIIYAKRDRNIIENSIRSNYAFNNKMNLSFRLRHYWARVVNYDYFSLHPSNGLLETTTYDEVNDTNFNAFNIDAIFRWRFAPGSDLFVIWKNAILGSEINNQLPSNYFSNISDELGNLPQSNSLSIKFIYYVDYQQLKK